MADGTIAITPGSGETVDVTDISVSGSTVARQRVVLAGNADATGLLELPAHDAADSGPPLKVGGYAALSLPTAVSGDGDRVNARFTREGALATVATPVANKVWVDGTGLVSLGFASASGPLNNTGTSIVSAAGGSLRNYVTAINVVCITTFTSAGYVALRDGAGSLIAPVCGITAVNTGGSMRAPAGGFLCYTTANTALHIFYSGNATLFWVVTYYQAP